MGEGSCITLFLPSDVTAFHRMKYEGGGSYITLFSPSDVTAFHTIIKTTRYPTAHNMFAPLLYSRMLEGS